MHKQTQEKSNKGDEYSWTLKTRNSRNFIYNLYI